MLQTLQLQTACMTAVHRGIIICMRSAPYPFTGSRSSCLYQRCAAQCITLNSVPHSWVATCSLPPPAVLQIPLPTLCCKMHRAAWLTAELATCCLLPLPQILAPAVVVLALPMYIAAGLQQRWQAHLLPPTPAWQFAAAAVVHALCTLLGCWALCTNKFFSSVVSMTSVCNLAVLC
jgi:hypothetical protein